MTGYIHKTLTAGVLTLVHADPGQTFMEEVDDEIIDKVELES